MQFQKLSFFTFLVLVGKFNGFGLAMYLSWVALLAGGDVLALIVFAAIGRFSHGFSVFDTETLRTADPFIAGAFCSCWFGLISTK